MVIPGTGIRGNDDNELLGAYVPTLVLDWLRDQPAAAPPRARLHARVRRHLGLHADDRDARRPQGKIGAEEMADLINATFEPLLATAYAYGAGLIKWGGDATLLLFQGAGHAGARMPRGIRDAAGDAGDREPTDEPRPAPSADVGRHPQRSLRLLPAGARRPPRPLRRRARGDHAGRDGEGGRAGADRDQRRDRRGARGQRPQGPLHAGRRPAGSCAVPPSWPGPDAWRSRWTSPGSIPVWRSRRILREHVLGRGLESEHRHAAVGFLTFSGVDRLLRERGSRATQVAARPRDHHAAVRRRRQRGDLSSPPTSARTGARCCSAPARRDGSDATRTG